MRNIYTIIVFSLFLSTNLASQHNLNPCGHTNYKTDWFKNYLKSPQSYEKRFGDVLYVPLTIHLVGLNSGGGAFSEFLLMEALCTLNEDFVDSDIQFYIKGDINYLNNSAYYDHGDILVGAEMMFENNVDNTINTYIVDGAAGNCGYNLPYAGVALAKMCTNPEDHTWAHEIGHNLSVQHTFLGWEGGVSYDGSVPHSFTDPAPEMVTYNYTLFKDTLILDTLIIDTAIVEKVDGSNCHIAADGFCDTAPDYLANRWNCNGQSQSPATQLDPNGTPFNSDASLIMSYAFDACSYRFTEEQSGAMRANLLDEKADYLMDEYLPSDMNATELALDYPVSEETIHYQDIEFAWPEIDGADFYILTVYNTNPVLPGVLLAGFTTLVYNNSFYIDNMTMDKTYVWEVTAYSNTQFCSGLLSAQETFSTANILSTDDGEDNSGVSLQPNISSINSSINLTSNKYQINSFKLMGVNGQQYSEQDVFGLSYNIDLTGISSGAYIVRCILDGGIIVNRRLLVTD